MQRDLDSIQTAIRTRVRELATALGNDPSGLTDDDIIPMTGLLDSAAIMDLVVWFENYLGKPLPQSDVHIDNFGSIRMMAEYGKARLT